ncbi:MAG TPA: BON domain-containing protein [Bryobacteraceae bacterium]|nr:BON domain-containing protein [Bryobacteraceae bacterium]
MRLFASVLVFALLVAPLFAEKHDAHVSDDSIIDQVRVKLINDPDTGGQAIQVDSHDGAVTLAGKVRSEKQREKAVKLTKKVKGVVSVDDKLVISPD